MSHERMDLEEIREALRDRGYLRTRAGRWFLGDLLRPHTWAGIAIRSSARAALLGGLLWGPGLFLLSLGGEWGRGAPIPDRVALLAWLAGASALALFVSLLVAALVLRAVVALLGGLLRVRLLAGAMALGFGGGGLAYLAAWWGGRAALLLGRSPTPLETAAALALAALLSLGIGAAARYAALAVLFRAGLEPEAPRPLPVLSLVALLAGALVACFAILQVRSPGGGTAGAFRPPAGWRDAGRSLVWIGVDGAGEEIASAAGGAGFVLRLSCSAEDNPPGVWATYASGFTPARHGVTGFTALGLAGLDPPLAHGSPADTMARALDTLLPRSRLVRIRAISGDLRREKYLFAAAAESGIPVAVFNWWASAPGSEGPGYVAPPDSFPVSGDAPGRNLDNRVARSALETGSGARVLAVYLPGADVDRGRQGVDASAAHLPALVREVAGRAAGPRSVLAILVDPGRAADRGTRTAVLRLSGDGIAEGETGPVSPLDVAPTLAMALGLPLSAEWEGRPVLEAFTPDFLAAHPPLRVEGFGRATPRPGARGSQETLERLRSLGYIR